MRSEVLDFLYKEMPEEMQSIFSSFERGPEGGRRKVPKEKSEYYQEQRALRKLMTTVLLHGVLGYIRGDKLEKQWLFEDGDPDYPFSMISVCEFLKVDRNVLRRKIEEHKQRYKQDRKSMRARDLLVETLVEEEE